MHILENATGTTTVTTETGNNTTETIRLLIKGNPKITGKELASRCGITEDGVAYHIKKLKSSGKIRRKGKHKCILNLSGEK